MGRDQPRRDPLDHPRGGARKAAGAARRLPAPRQPKTPRPNPLAHLYTPVYASAFAGIEAASVGADGLGWQCRWLAQYDPDDRDQFSASVLRRRYPKKVNLGDICKIVPEYATSLDLLVGGSPCQAFSVAGKRADREDPRGELTETFMKLALKAHVTPSRRGVQGIPVLLWENVHGALSVRCDEVAIDAWKNAEQDADKLTRKSAGLPEKMTAAEAKAFSRALAAQRIERFDQFYNDDRDLFGSVLATLSGTVDFADLEHKDTPPKVGAFRRPREKDGSAGSWPNAGYVLGPRRIVAYRVLDSHLFGATTKRKRLFLVACRNGDGIDPLEILFEQRPQFGPTIKQPGGAVFREIVGTTAQLEGPLQPVAADLDTNFDRAPDHERAFLLEPSAARSFRQRATTFASKRPERKHEEACPLWIFAALSLAEEGRPTFTPAELAVHIEPTLCWLETKVAEGKFPQAALDRYRMHKNIPVPDCDALLLDAYDHSIRESHACTMTAAYSRVRSKRPFVLRRIVGENGEPVYWLRSMTPDEGERIMGFPTGWTDIDWPPARRVEPNKAEDINPAAPYADDADGNDDAVDAPDTDTVPASEAPRFKALGNSMAVPVMRWLTRRIDTALRQAVTDGTFIPDRRHPSFTLRFVQRELGVPRVRLSPFNEPNKELRHIRDQSGRSLWAAKNPALLDLADQVLAATKKSLELGYGRISIGLYKRSDRSAILALGARNKNIILRFRDEQKTDQRQALVKAAFGKASYDHTFRSWSVTVSLADVKEAMSNVLNGVTRVFLQRMMAPPTSRQGNERCGLP